MNYLLLVFLFLLSTTTFANESTLDSCGYGTPISEGPGRSGHFDFRCCKSGEAVEFSYSVVGGSHSDKITYWVGPSDVSNTASVAMCSVRDDSTCTGNGCVSNFGNDCGASNVQLAGPSEVCLYVRCDNSWYNCNADSYTFSISTVSTTEGTNNNANNNDDDDSDRANTTMKILVWSIVSVVCTVVLCCGCFFGRKRYMKQKNVPEVIEKQAEVV
jgi:hypothetical protein